jgi:hypothetical protein
MQAFPPDRNGGGRDEGGSSHEGEAPPLQCDEEELLEIPDNWIPVRLERNAYWTMGRKDYTRFVLEPARSTRAGSPPRDAALSYDRIDRLRRP